MPTDMQIFVVLQKSVPELRDFKFLKMGQNLHANMEGFRRDSHICNGIIKLFSQNFDRGHSSEYRL